MERRSHQLSFNDAVRLGTRVPMLVSLFVLGALGLVVTTQWPYVDAALRGAPVASAQDVLIGRRGPVRVVVDVVVPKTPLTPANALEMVSTSQLLVGISGNVAPDQLRSGAPVWGVLRPMNAAEQAALQMETLANGPSGANANASATPVRVLDTEVPKRHHLLGLVALAVVAAFGAITVLVRAVGVVQQPLRSAVGRRLARFGDPSVVRDSFDAALAEEHPVVGRMHAPNGFVAFRSRAGFSVVPRADVMWVRQRKGPDPVFLSVVAFPLVLLRGLSSRSMYVHERSGYRLRVPMSSRKERAVVRRELEALCPHSIFVDDKATRKYWRSHRRHFIDAVDQRRVNVEHFRMGSYEGSESSLSGDSSVSRSVAPPLAAPLSEETSAPPVVFKHTDTTVDLATAESIDEQAGPLTFALKATDPAPVGSPA